jgi:hypothetical protein
LENKKVVFEYIKKGLEQDLGLAGKTSIKSW